MEINTECGCSTLIINKSTCWSVSNFSFYHKLHLFPHKNDKSNKLTQHETPSIHFKTQTERWLKAPVHNFRHNPQKNTTKLMNLSVCPAAAEAGERSASCRSHTASSVQLWTQPGRCDQAYSSSTVHPETQAEAPEAKVPDQTRREAAMRPRASENHLATQEKMILWRTNSFLT